MGAVDGAAADGVVAVGAVVAGKAVAVLDVKALLGAADSVATAAALEAELAVASEAVPVAGSMVVAADSTVEAEVASMAEAADSTVVVADTVADTAKPHRVLIIRTETAGSKPCQPFFFCRLSPASSCRTVLSVKKGKRGLLVQPESDPAARGTR